MFEVYTNTVQTVTTTNPVIFNTVKFDDCRVNIDGVGTTLTICTPGCYLIHFDAIAGSTVAATPFAIQMYVNGIADPSARSTNTATVANEANPLSFDTLVQVKPSCDCVSNSLRIQFIATSASPGTVSHANVTVIRL